MDIAIGITGLLLLALTFLATVDMAFGQLSDVGLRRLISEAEEQRPMIAPRASSKRYSMTARVFVSRSRR